MAKDGWSNAPDYVANGGAQLIDRYSSVHCDALAIAAIAARMKSCDI
jgi:hypothetical protein